jgi:hypothetical protein
MRKPIVTGLGYCVDEAPTLDDPYIVNCELNRRIQPVVIQDRSDTLII